mgnify:CR=1 FL=1
MKQRIITGVIAGILFLTFFYLGGSFFMGLMLALGLIGLSEIIKLIKLPLSSFPSILSFIAFIFFFFRSFDSEVLLVSFSLLLMVIVTFRHERFTFQQVGALMFAVIFMGVGFSSFAAFRETNLTFTLFVLLVIWCTDSGAYFMGKAFGKRKLAPTISPNKTIEGSAGGVVIALIFAIIYQSFTHMMDSFGFLMLITCLISISAQLGDLLQSAVKRIYNVKDSGRLLPGHGGIWDRFDSLLFVFVVLWMVYPFFQ